MRPGGDIDSVQPGAPLHPEAVPIILDLDPCRAELQDQGSQVGRLGLLQDRLPAGCRDRDRVGTRLDVVRDDPVGRAAELGGAFDLQDVSADPPDAGTHPSQEHRQVHHVRLARCVVDGGHAVGHGRGHHQVLGAGHSRHVQVDGGASQTVGSGDVFAVLQLHVGAHQAQPDDVLFHPAHADVVTARFGHPGLAPPRQHRTHEQKGRPHFAGQRGQHVTPGQA